MFNRLSVALSLPAALTVYNKIAPVRLSSRKVAVLFAVHELTEGAKPVAVTRVYTNASKVLFRLTYPMVRIYMQDLANAGYLSQTISNRGKLTYTSYSLTISGLNVLHDLETLLKKAKRVKK